MAWWTDCCEWCGLTSVAVDSLFDALCRGYLDDVARVFGCDFVDFEWSGQCTERGLTRVAMDCWFDVTCRGYVDLVMWMCES